MCAHECFKDDGPVRLTCCITFGVTPSRTIALVFVHVCNDAAANLESNSLSYTKNMRVSTGEPSLCLELYLFRDAVLVDALRSFSFTRLFGTAHATSTVTLAQLVQACRLCVQLLANSLSSIVQIKLCSKYRAN